MEVLLCVGVFLFVFDMFLLVWILREDRRRHAAFMLREDGYTGAAADVLMRGIKDKVRPERSVEAARNEDQAFLAGVDLP